MKTIKQLWHKLCLLITSPAEPESPKAPEYKFQIDDEVMIMPFMGMYSIGAHQRKGTIMGRPIPIGPRQIKHHLVKFKEGIGEVEEMIAVEALVPTGRSFLYEDIIVLFRNAMQHEIEANMKTKGMKGFLNAQESTIFKELKDHCDKYWGAGYGPKEKRMEYAADIANLAMMLWWNIYTGQWEPKRNKPDESNKPT